MGNCYCRTRSVKVGSRIPKFSPSEQDEETHKNVIMLVSNTDESVYESHRRPSQDSDSGSAFSHDPIWDSDAGSSFSVQESPLRSPTSFGSFSGPGEFSDCCSSCSSRSSFGYMFTILPEIGSE